MPNSVSGKSYTFTSSGRHCRPLMPYCAYQFLLLRVYRYHLLPLILECLAASVDMLKLRVKIRMLLAFQRLALRLQPVAQLVQHAVHRPVH